MTPPSRSTPRPPVARAPSDISVTSTTLTVPEGATGVNFSVQATPDTADELDEPFTVTLSDPVRATIETASVTTNIIDDDTPALSIDNAGCDRGRWRGGLYGHAHRGGASPVTVNYQTANGLQRRLVTSPPRRHTS